MLGSIRAALGSDAVMIRLSASRALATIPFGAVNARLGSHQVGGNEYYEVLNGLLDQVQQAAKSANHVFLMVDNAEHLDSQSAAIILHVVMSSKAKLILVDHPGGHNTHLRELWRDGHLTRFELAPLQSHDVQVFLEGFLDGRVSVATADYFAQRSGGNPLVLQGLVTGAREVGSLRKIDHVWVLGHPGDTLGTESWEFLQMETNHLHPESRHIVELLALAGPLPLNILLELTNAAAIDELQQREIVEISPGATLTMRLVRQVTAPSIRAMIPVGRSRKFLADVTRLVPPDTVDNPEAIINFTRWSLECGLPVTGERILAATVAANHFMRPAEALRISAINPSSQASAALLAEQAIAKVYQNLGAKARALALRALDLASSAQEGARALRAMHMSHVSEPDYQGRMAAAFMVFEDRFGVVVLDDSSSRSDLDVLTVRTMVEVSLGEVQETQATIVALLQHPLLVDVGDRVLLKSLHCEILSAIGRRKDAAAMSREVLDELENPAGFPRPDIAILAYSRSVTALIYDGAWNCVIAALDPATFVNPDLMLYSGGLRDLARAMMACRRGQVGELLAAVEPAVVALTEYDPWSVLPTALGMQAYGLVMRGDNQGAQKSLAQVAQLNRRSGKFLELESAAYAAAAQCLIGPNELGLATLRGVQQECESNGYLGIELTVISLLLRVGDNSAITRLRQTAELVDASSRELFLRWATAMETQDPAALEVASDSALDNGYELMAVELATHAQQRFHDCGKVHQGRKTANKVIVMREKMPGVVSTAFQPIDQPKMTRREHQIALLVAQGESNNSIATRLGVSLRTIEGHLYRTFIKMDIQSREQLANLMRGDFGMDQIGQRYSAQRQLKNRVVSTKK